MSCRLASFRFKFVMPSKNRKCVFQDRKHSNKNRNTTIFIQNNLLILCCFYYIFTNNHAQSCVRAITQDP